MTIDKEFKEKNKAMDLAVSQIERQFGKGSIMKLGEPVQARHAGDLHHLALGGLRAGRRRRTPRAGSTRSTAPNPRARRPWPCTSSPRPSAAGGIAAFVDAEHALDPEYARKLGVDVDNLMVSQPDSGEQALEITEILIRSGALDVVVVDSVAALVPKAELDGEMGDSHVGLQARLMSQALRKLTGDRLQEPHLADLHQPDPREDRRHVRQPRRPPPAAGR